MQLRCRVTDLYPVRLPYSARGNASARRSGGAAHSLERSECYAKRRLGFLVVLVGQLHRRCWLARRMSRSRGIETAGQGCAFARRCKGCGGLGRSWRCRCQRRQPGATTCTAGASAACASAACASAARASAAGGIGRHCSGCGKATWLCGPDITLGHKAGEHYSRLCQSPVMIWPFRKFPTRHQ